MNKKLLVTLLASTSLVLSCGTFLVVKGIKDNKKDVASSSSVGELTQSGIYFCANGGTLSSLGNYDGKDNSVTTFVAYSSSGDKYIDFSMDRYIPTRKGYTFGGWFSSPTLESDTRIEGFLKVEDEIKKIYAYWKEEDKPTIYNYEVTTTYARIYGFESSLYDSSFSYKLKIPSYIEGYPVKYISTSNDAESFGKPNVYEVTLPETLVYLYANSFSTSNIERISIPSSVTTIGSNAFSSCKVLKEVEIGVKNPSLTSIQSRAFYNCESLETINIPSSITTIGDSAFEKCTKLSNISIPENIDTIGTNILKDTEAEKNLLSKDGFVFINDSIAYEYKGEESIVVIPENTKILANGIFQNNTKIEEIDFSLARSLTKINTNAFRGCTSLTSKMNLPSSITNIGSYAFKDVPADIDVSRCSFTNNELPSSCFEGAKAKSIAIPYVKTIGSYAFRNCTSLENIKLPSTLLSIQSSAFNGCSSLKSIIIPDSVTSISQSVFANCTSLISFSFPANITRISQSLFQGCSSLSKVELNKNITTIDSMAFKDCTNISSITFPSSSLFTSIGNRIFEGWTDKQTITFVGISEKKLQEINKPLEYTIDDEKVLCSWNYACKAKIIYN